MKFKPKSLKDQTIVITGASSGIGLATARMAAEKGAKVVLAAREIDELNHIVKSINSTGGNALAVETDVSKLDDLVKLGEESIKKYGRIDTWINNAGTSIYGYLLDADFEEEKKLFETNFWGARWGSQIAVNFMKENGGVLINLGSEVSVAAQPLLGMYSASKHALKAFTEALRSELRDKQFPIEVCLVRPTAIDTPFADHGANRLDAGEPSLPSPLYHPDVAASAILKCAENPQRDVYVGGPARLSAILDTFFPTVKDMMAESRMKELKLGTEVAHRETNESLDHASADVSEEQGHMNKPIATFSAYTELTTLGVLKTLKDNLKTSIKELRKQDSH
jgi:short-subunit dehydrogenase